MRVAFTLATSASGLGALVDALWDRLDVNPKARNNLGVLMQRETTRWLEKPSGTSNRLLVVFVDDLDRCQPANVVEIFEAIRLYVEAPGIVFVVGYDPDVVTDAVLQVADRPSRGESHDYLETFVQTVYSLPQPRDEAAHALTSSYLDASGTTDMFDEAARDLVIEQTARNPRRIKRFLNAFTSEVTVDSGAISPRDSWRT